MEILPTELMPDGYTYFNNDTLSLDKALVVHNNWIKGSGRKRERFVKRNMWYVQGLSFPKCRD